MLWLLLLLLEEVDGRWMYDGCVCGFRDFGGDYAYIMRYASCV